ncbi:MAG TPA: chromate resistance protein ChrB domain-containing protein [Dehalococcoidales bacterium]|nr:chromate resistance protein ChrB domain-containing protein [Dehalococcoidales bacterium]
MQDVVIYVTLRVMEWLAFSYSLPSREGSSLRVAVWRRFRRLGAITIAGSVQVLPAREECWEAFQWLSQEIAASNGEAMTMRVTQIEGLTDRQVISLFRAARAEDYRHIEAHAGDLLKNLAAEERVDSAHAQDALKRLRRRYSDILRIDYFNCPEGKRVASRLDSIERSISPPVAGDIVIPHEDIEQFRNRRWVTRPQPHVDRLSCAWLIRRFINPEAEIRYSNTPGPDEISFDMKNDRFGHRGILCTFETMLLAFRLENPALQPLAEIVHEIDMHDDRFAWPEIAGIERLLDGWSLSDLSDSELEKRGISLFEGLYQAFSVSVENNNGQG